MHILYCARCNAMQYHKLTDNNPYIPDGKSFDCERCRHSRTGMRECAHSPACKVDPATRGANTSPQMRATAQADSKSRSTWGAASVIGLLLVLLAGCGCAFYVFNPIAILTHDGKSPGASPTPTVAVNSVNPGADVPIVLDLGGNKGTKVVAAGYPKDRVVNCGDWVERAADHIESATAAPDVRFNPKTGHYTYTWKTGRDWSKSCRELVFKFTVDVPDLVGGQLVMDFRFT